MIKVGSDFSGVGSFKNKNSELWNAKLKIVKDTQTQENLETYVLCTTKECLEMDALMIQKQQKNLKTES